MAKKIQDLDKDIASVSKRLENALIRAVDTTGKTLLENVKSKAPVKTGEYISSIQKSNVEINEGYAKVSVYTDMKTEDGYLIGRIIEHGTGLYATEPHIGHTKTFKESGYSYWFIPPEKSKTGDWVTCYSQIARPHFQPALDTIEEPLKENLRNAIKEAFKK